MKFPDNIVVECGKCGSHNMEYNIDDYERTITIYCKDCDNEVEI
jgi:hypothetical protein